MTAFASPLQLRYRPLAYRFRDGQALPLDESYRVCHLPLIAPDHPDVIARKGEYEMGWFPTPSYALIVPVDADKLEASPHYRQMIAALRRAPFGDKIDWAMGERRRKVLHATLRSHLHSQHSDRAIRHLVARLRQVKQFRARLLGPWMGDKNHGRLYLPLVPESRNGVDPCARMQRAAGGKPTRLYTMGLIHFRDHLNADEASALRVILRVWRDRVLLDYRVREIWLQATHDSLALDARTVTRIPLRD
jgi:hypothetical protein